LATADRIPLQCAPPYRQASPSIRRFVDISYLRDTLAVLATVQDSPGDATGVLSLQEQRLGLAVLESEDLAVATDIDLTLSLKRIR
jgi:hypothetical protein